MAGPGGGRSGGSRSSGSRSSGGSGSSSSRSYSGGHRHHHYHHYGYHYYGGGIGSVGIIFIALIIFCSILPFLVVNTGTNNYEQTLHEYANQQYQSIFNSSNRYENNILFLYVVDDECETFDAIAWVGDDVPSRTNLKLDGYTISKHVNENYYKYQLSSGISMSIEELIPVIDTANYKSTNICTVVNNSNLSINQAQIETVLQDLSTTRGYGVAVVVADYDDIYVGGGSNGGLGTVFTILIVGLIGGAVLFVIIQKKKQRDENMSSSSNNYSTYSDDNPLF